MGNDEQAYGSDATASGIISQSQEVEQRSRTALNTPRSSTKNVLKVAELQHLRDRISQSIEGVNT